MIRRLAVLLAALCLALGFAAVAAGGSSAVDKPPDVASGSTSSLVNGKAQTAAALSSVWRVYYGDGYGSNTPQVYSNRQPTWDTGGDPKARFETNGDFRDQASFCPNGGLCWHTGGYASYPDHLVWQGDLNPVAYGANGHAYWSAGVVYPPCPGQSTGCRYGNMTLWSNGCLTIHGYVSGHWSWSWANSTSSACAIVESP